MSRSAVASQRCRWLELCQWSTFAQRSSTSALPIPDSSSSSATGPVPRTLQSMQRQGLVQALPREGCDEKPDTHRQEAVGRDRADQRRIREPAMTWRPCCIYFMPSKKMPRPPTSRKPISEISSTLVIATLRVRARTPANSRRGFRRVVGMHSRLHAEIVASSAVKIARASTVAHRQRGIFE